MRYIDEKRKKIEININDFQFFDNGACGEIYYNNDKDIILKKYYSYTTLSDRLDVNVFDVLKQINHPNFIKLYKLFFDFNNYSSPKEQPIDIYTAKYYQKEDITPAFVNKDYLLDNFNSIERLFEIFSNANIKVYDVKPQNTVFTKELIIIIDPDYYKISKDGIKDIKIWNKKNLFALFKQLLLYGLDCEDWGKMINWIYNNINANEITENTDLACELSKKLQYIKKPIDVIRK